MNATQAFLGDPDNWDRVRVELRDVHGLWGGHNCFVWGSGRVVAQAVDAARHETRAAASVPPAAIVGLLLALIDADIVDLRPPARTGLPDEACPTVLVYNAAGECRQASKWAGDHHPGFEAVYQALGRLAGQALAGQRLYDGPFEHDYAPE